MNASVDLYAVTNTTIGLFVAVFTVFKLKVKYALHVLNYKSLILMKGIVFHTDFGF
jgi:hypothetical protein